MIAVSRPSTLKSTPATRLTVSMTSSTEKPRSAAVAQIGERIGMRGDRIANVNIIPNAGAIRRRVIGAEDIGSQSQLNGDRDRLSVRRVNECERNSAMFAID